MPEKQSHKEDQSSLRQPEREGWESRFIGSEPRLSEMVELYEELGFEVLVEPIKPEECDGCTECFKDAVVPVFAVYTREKET